MQINTQKFALSAAETIGILYAVCTVFITIAPDFALQLIGWMAHIVNINALAGSMEITLVGLIIGFLQAVIYTYATVWIFAWIYNRSIAKNK